jgi:hypothetical protein
VGGLLVGYHAVGFSNEGDNLAGLEWKILMVSPCLESAAVSAVSNAEKPCA